ncbi:MAG: aldo/keto reductase, partial [Pseudonocardiaceae bacterium]
GLVQLVGMRGPHRYAPDRLIEGAPRENKHARFRELFEVIRPEVLTVRYNLLTPGRSGNDDIFTFAAHRGAVVLVNKPLGQGLLTGKYDPQQPPVFGDGDHRQRKRWFTSAALAILHDELAPLRERFGAQPADLIRVALRYCLRAHTVLIVGFTRPEQVVENLTCLGEPLTAADVEFIAEVGQRAQKALDAAGGVFLDEVPVESDPIREAD